MTTDGHREEGAAALQFLLECLPGAQFLVRGTRILWAGEAALTLCGCAASGSVAGRELGEFVDLDAQVLRTLSAAPDMGSVDCLWQPPGDGDAQPVQVAFGRPLDDGLRPVTVTPIRQASGEQRYRRLLESWDEAIFVQRDGELVYVNPAAARMLGFDAPDELYAINDMSRFVVPDQRDIVNERHAARVRGEDVERRYEVDGVRRDGRRIRVQLNASQVEWEGGPAQQIRLVDVTGRAEQAARAERAQRMESLGKLTGGIAHDFNNLLAVILGNLELLALDLADRPAAVGMLAQAQTAADRGVELTGRLLTFARRQALDAQRVVLEPLLTETRGMLSRVLGEDIDVRILVETDAPVETDPGQLQTALINLAINARDAMPGGGRLTLATRLVDSAEMLRCCGEALPMSHVCIEVGDSGEGMPPAVLAQAFEPFFTTKSEGRGSGLGLSMVHGFVQQSRGQVEIDSAPGSGTRVRLYLPVFETGPEQVEQVEQGEPGPGAAAGTTPAAAGPAAPRVPEHALRVLVVEDEASVREVAVAMLRGIGFEVFEAADGVSARAVLERERLDLLLSDVVLPGDQRGPDIALEALARQPDLAVLFMSGYAESSDFQQFRREHAFSLLRKPFRLGELRSRIDEVLARARK